MSAIIYLLKYAVIGVGICGIHDLARCFDFNENGDNDNLINCPFCGGYAEYERRQPKEGYYPVPEIRAVCGNCAIGTMWVPEKDKVQTYPEKFSPMFPESYTPTDDKADVTRITEQTSA